MCDCLCCASFHSNGNGLSVQPACKSTDKLFGTDADAALDADTAAVPPKMFFPAGLDALRAVEHRWHRSTAVSAEAALYPLFVM